MEKGTSYIKNKVSFIILILIPIIIWFVDFNANNNDFTFCIFKNIFGKNCYGCGTLRGISAILHLEFKKCVQLNPLNIISLPILSYLYLRSIFITIKYEH